MKLHVQERAAARGITTAYKFSQAAGIGITSAYVIWKGNAKQVDFRTLEKICKALKCSPGKLIKKT